MGFVVGTGSDKLDHGEKKKNLDGGKKKEKVRYWYGHSYNPYSSSLGEPP